MKSFLLILLTFCCSYVKSQNVNVTFQVDMNAETISAFGVHIAGNFQTAAGLGDNWAPGSTLVSDTNSDGVYEITVSLPTGTYEYKFINGNAWGMNENPPSDCSIGTNHNREVVVGNTELVLPVVPFNGCIIYLHLAVNMTGQVVSSDGVHVMGDFQQAAGFPDNWDPSSIALTDLNKDGTYEVKLNVPFGDYQYLFVNGKNKNAEEILPAECTVPGANGKQNRPTHFSANDNNLTVHCFNSCVTCDPSVVFDYDTYWWNDAVFYEIFVRSFFDHDANGIGDFKGLTDKLDYLNDGNPDTHNDLGITGIWLMPMMSSPSYHGYDITNYYATEPDYGSMEDFEAFLTAAHARGIKVIIDMVMNHSSNQNPWFTQSANSTGDYRNWYRWSDINAGYLGPWGQTVWHNRNGKYYYGLFGSGLPDLNYSYPPVKAAMFDVINFWLDRGVDGYRLDAIKYLFEDGQQLENTNETFDILKELHEVYKTNNPDAFTVGEVWSNTTSIIPYVQDERLDACFEFGLAGSVIDAVNNGNVANLEQQLSTVLDDYPALQYGTFLTNHDMDRVFGVLSSNTEKMKLAASIYLTLPGIPFLYYGEEIGMIGAGDDPSKRRPMQWADKTNAGFSTVTPWSTPGSNYHTNNVEEMGADPNSLLSHYRKLIGIRNMYESLRRGQTLMLEDNEDLVFSFARLLNHEGILVLANAGTPSVDPFLSLNSSSLSEGEYFVTELLTNHSVGKITINENGGFAGWHSDIKSLSGRTTWILLVSIENPVTAISEPLTYHPIKVTPNPATDSFQITLDQNEFSNAYVQVFSSAGISVFQKKMIGYKMNINTTGWAAGIYTVQLKGENELEIGRVIVTKE